MEPKHPTSGNGNVKRPSARGESARSAEGAQIEHEAMEGIEALRRQAEDLGDRVAQLVRERPMTAMLIAIGAGIIVGRLLRA